MFSFYAVSFLPFIIMAIAICLGFILGPSSASATRRTIGATAVGAYLLLAALAGAELLPLWWAQVIPYDDWLGRLFGLRSWV
jgi:dolichyl-phosphate-mannose--protein O-mannosyl transferase